MTAFFHTQSFSLRYAFPVVFTRHLFAPRNTTLLRVIPPAEPAGPARCLVIVDSALPRAFPELSAQIRAWFAAHERYVFLPRVPLILPGGERAKQQSKVLVEPLLDALQSAAICRHSYCIAIGGGAFLDAAGLAAALFHRGVRLIRVPTTALSQCDSGVGVKNAINHRGAKNLLGTFAPPWAVLNDSAFLDVLPRPALLDGIAEAVKVSAIRSPALFRRIEQAAPQIARGRLPVLRTILRDCALLHLRHIATSGDPFEMGSARPLDYGHWIAHKLETLSGHRLSHGHAVSIGIATDALYAAAMHLLPEASAWRIVHTLRACGLPVTAPEILWTATRRHPRSATPSDLRILQGLEEFRSHLGGSLTLTLPSPRMGHSTEIHAIDPAILRPILQTLAHLPPLPSRT